MLKLYEDNRIGGKSRYYLAKRPEHLMRVPDTMLKGVVFLCAKKSDTHYPPGGTAFFVAMPGSGELIFGYLITAKHVIEDIAKDSIDQKIYIRANLVDGKISNPLETNQGDWKSHPTDKTVDIAVFPFLPSSEKFDHGVVPIESSVTETILKDENIGIGDEVLIVGLFTRRAGREKNIPIIRIGNIAAMADEPIHTRYGDARMHLIECRSIGGLSGSPVYVHKPMLKIDKDAKAELIDTGRLRLLGILHGHWDVDLDTSKTTFQLYRTIQNEAVNMGIALVTPIERAVEVLNNPDQKKLREESIQKYLENEMPTTDSSIEIKSENDDIFTEQDFENVLSKVSRRDESDNKKKPKRKKNG